MGKRTEQMLPKEDTQMTNKYMTNCPTSLVIRKMQTKTLWDNFTHPLEQLKLKRFIAPNLREDVKQTELTYFVHGMYNGTTSLGKGLEISYKTKCKPSI